MVLRLCLKDKSSILIDGNMEEIVKQVHTEGFITVINHKKLRKQSYIIKIMCGV